MQLFVDALTNVDFSYLDAKRGLLGETWHANIVLKGELDDQGMICDFGKVKAIVRDWLDTYVDHCLLVPEKSASANISSKAESISVKWTLANSSKHIHCTAPNEAISLIDAEHITPESVASWCAKQLKKLFPGTVDQLTLSFTPERIDGPYYHYSHGLKHHDGNCQRIAHGHRSKIEIWRNGALSRDDMNMLAAQWRDIYIGTREDISEQSNSYFSFAYESAQGVFELSLPSQAVSIVETDTTVENIAKHIHQQLKQKSPDDYFRVKAYEGINKGAVFEG